MLQSSLYSKMLQFALTDSIFESERRYKENDLELRSFANNLSSKSRDLSSDRFKVEQERIKEISDDQERLQTTLPKLTETQERFESLTVGEKQALHTRLADQSGDLKLVLQRRNGELLAQAN